MSNKGKIYCSRCGADFSKQTAGVCPKCGSPKCFISLYWKRPDAPPEEKSERYKFYNDVLRGNVPLYWLTARDQLAAMNRDIQAKKFNPADWNPETVNLHKVKALATDWISAKQADVAKRELKPGSLHLYKSHIQTHIVPKLGEKDIAALDYDLLKAFKDNLPEHLSKKTQREILHTLHNFLVWCETEKKVLKAVPRMPKVKGKDSKPKRSLTVVQKIQALVQIPEQHRDFYEFEMRTGIRPGEACALKVKDVLIDLGAIRIQRNFSHRVLVESDKEDHKMLLALTKRSQEIVQKHMTGKGPEDFLFTNPEAGGRHYTVHTTELYWKKWSGTGVTHYEATRHSAATQMTEMFDIRAAQRMLRQADLSSTQHYVHEAIEDLRSKMEQYDAAMPADALRTVQAGIEKQELQGVNGGRGWESNLIWWLIYLAFLPPTDDLRTD